MVHSLTEKCYLSYVKPANVGILPSHRRNLTHRGYRQQLHVWMDKCVAIFTEWYNVTDRCYPLQLCYIVIFCTMLLRCEQHLLHDAVCDCVTL